MVSLFKPPEYKGLEQLEEENWKQKLDNYLIT